MFWLISDLGNVLSIMLSTLKNQLQENLTQYVQKQVQAGR